MNKFRWLTSLGILCLIAVVLVGLIGFSDRDSQISFIILGTILSFIMMGLGEILYHLKNGGKKE